MASSIKKREVCTSVRDGHLCSFMIKDIGCSFNDNYCRPISSLCKIEEKSCDHIINVNNKEYCNAYMFPENVWKNVNKCPLETHLPREDDKKKEVLDPRKAAKQRRRKG